MFQVKLASPSLNLLNQAFKVDETEVLSLTEVINYLNQTSSQKLRLALLQDFISSLETAFNKKIYTPPPAPKLSWKQKLTMGLGIGAGLLNAISDAFGNISVLLTTLFDALTAGFALLWVSLAFALFCAGAFLVFRLAIISKSTNIPFFKVRQTLSDYVAERRMLNELLKFMDTGTFITLHQQHEMTRDELLRLQSMLHVRGQFLKTKSDELGQIRQGYFPTMVRGFLITSLSIWSLTSGFMIGFFAIAMFTALIPAVVIPIWGCAVFGAFVGLAAFYLFWTTARSEVMEGIDCMIGADVETINHLAEQVDMDLVVFKVPIIDMPPLAPPNQENYDVLFEFEAVNESERSSRLLQPGT